MLEDVSGRSASPAAWSWKEFLPTAWSCCFCSISDWPPSILNLCQWPFCSAKSAPPKTWASEGLGVPLLFMKNMLISTWSLSQLTSFIGQFRCIFNQKKKNVTHKTCVLFGINLMTSACDLRIRRIKLMLYYASPTPTYSNFHQQTWFNDIESSVVLDFHHPVQGLSALELTTPGNESDRD